MIEAKISISESIAEARQGHRARLDRGNDDDGRTDDIPAKRQIFEIEAAPEQRRGQG